MNDYKIQTRQTAGKWIATVLKLKGVHWKEGESYETLAVAMAKTEGEAITQAVTEAFS